MKAVVLKGHGGPEQLEYLVDVPIPEPEAGQVRIRIGGAGINNTDIWTREGAYGWTDDPITASGRPIFFPRIQGADFAGEIDAVGVGVAPERMGERVLVNPTLYDDNGEIIGMVGSEMDGGFAEYAVVPTENAYRIQTDMTDEELATFPTAYLTAECMLDRSRVEVGESVLITGASGGVGSALIQLARLRGCRAIALTSAAKVSSVRALEPDCILLRDEGEIENTLEKSAEVVDVVVDVVGGGVFQPLLNALRPGGRYVIAGAIGGAEIPFDLRTLYLKPREVIGSVMGTQEQFGRLVTYIESNRLKPLIAQRFALAAIHEAQATFIRKEFCGNLVLRPD